MCGLGGEVRFDGAPPDIAAVRRMTQAMRHRGPDASGVWASDWVALGHRRLKIIDMSCEAAQPMADQDLNIVLVFNGCIYNFAELRQRLSGNGYRFFSAGDTEVIIKAYHFWGESFVEHLIGMFALVLIDRARRRVIMARDRLGIKPLYLAEDPRRLRFASTIQALLRAGQVDASVDLEALHHQLAWRANVPAPLTICRGVRKLPPATIRVIDASGRSYDRVYWQPAYQRDSDRDQMAAGDWAEAVRSALTEAVQRRLVADVPVGVLLSGGLDSSLIVALIARSGGPSPRTFSIGFEAAHGEAGDEFHWSDMVARQFATDHQKLRISGRELLGALPAAVAAMSEPMISRDAVAFYLLSREVAKSVRVVQTGQGADEVFAGYFWHRGFAEDSIESASERAAHLFVNHEITAALCPAARCGNDVSREFIRSHLRASGASSGIDALLRFDTHVTMAEGPVKRVDNMSMAWGLEARMAFTDHQLVELAAQCPPELKLSQGGKGILKAIASQLLLPKQLIDRPKGYFPVPALVHLDPKVRGWLCELLLSPAARDRRLIDRRFLLATVQGTPSPQRDRVLWQLGMLECWLQSLPGPEDPEGDARWPDSAAPITVLGGRTRTAYSSEDIKP